MRVMVTGGAGYVGSVSVERLVAAGHDVLVLDDLSTGHGGSVPAGVRLVRASFGDPDDVARAMAEHGTDAVLHCAAKSLVGESVTNPATGACRLNVRLRSADFSGTATASFRRPSHCA